MESRTNLWLRVALTGGIACGKSLAGRYLRELGMPVIEADEVCHAFLRPATAAARQVVAAFGVDILDGQGVIDRSRLAAVVFADQAARRRLEAILHPLARTAIDDWLTAQRRRGGAGACAIIPLLYEAGWAADWDRVICVAAPATLQLERLRQRGLTLEQAQTRLAAQQPLAEKMKQADFVVFNAGTPADLQWQVRRIMQQLARLIHETA